MCTESFAALAQPASMFAHANCVPLTKNLKPCLRSAFEGMLGCTTCKLLSTAAC